MAHEYTSQAGGLLKRNNKYPNKIKVNGRPVYRLKRNGVLVWEASKIIRASFRFTPGVKPSDYEGDWSKVDRNDVGVTAHPVYLLSSPLIWQRISDIRYKLTEDLSVVNDSDEIYIESKTSVPYGSMTIFSMSGISNFDSNANRFTIYGWHNPNKAPYALSVAIPNPGTYTYRTRDVQINRIGNYTLENSANINETRGTISVVHESEPNVVISEALICASEDVKKEDGPLGKYTNLWLGGRVYTQIYAARLTINASGGYVVVKYGSKNTIRKVVPAGNGLGYVWVYDSGRNWGGMLGTNVSVHFFNKPNTIATRMINADINNGAGGRHIPEVGRYIYDNNLNKIGEDYAFDVNAASTVASVAAAVIGR